MATSRASLPKSMTPFGKAASKGKAAPKGNPFGDKKAKPFGFAKGGYIPAEDSPTHAAAPASNPPSHLPIDDGKPSGGGTMKGMGAATRGGKFLGTF